jgi:hypothetical protein
MEKHARYTRLGDPTPRPLRTAPSEIFLEQTARVRPYRGTHPRVVRPLIRELEARNAVEFNALDEAFTRGRTPAMRLTAAARGLKEMLRVRLRRWQHPRLYAARTIAR